MVEVCQAVLDGELDRLMIHAPPRYFKSRVVVQGLGSCWVRNHPDQFVALLFASDKLAKFHSMHTREAVERAGVKLRTDSHDKGLWMVDGSHGGLWLTTIRGKPLGFGWRLGIVDDPLGSYEEAQGVTGQEIAERAFDSFVERQEKGQPKPVLVVMHQRLAALDLAGRLYQREIDSRRAEGWTVLEMAAERRPRRVAMPGSCTVVQDPRENGEALCPDLEGVDEIQARQERDPVRAASVDGQEPLEMMGGGIFRQSWFRLVGIGRDDLGRGPRFNDQLAVLNTLVSEGVIAPIRMLLRGHDFSAGGKDTTTSVGLAVLEPGQGLEYLWFDMTEDSPAAAAVEGKALSNALRDDTDVEQVIPNEVGTGGTLSASLAGQMRKLRYTVHVQPQRRGKRVRAMPHAGAAAPLCRGCGALVVSPAERRSMSGSDLCGCGSPDVTLGKVGVLSGPLADRFVSEHHEFTGEEGGRDNLVDAAALAYLVAISVPAVKPRDWSSF